MSAYSVHAEITERERKKGVWKGKEKKKRARTSFWSSDEQEPPLAAVCMTPFDDVDHVELLPGLFPLYLHREGGHRMVERQRLAQGTQFLNIWHVRCGDAVRCLYVYIRAQANVRLYREKEKKVREGEGEAISVGYAEKITYGLVMARELVLIRFAPSSKRTDRALRRAHLAHRRPELDQRLVHVPHAVALAHERIRGGPEDVERAFVLWGRVEREEAAQEPIDVPI